jgi:hypothetical protein
MRTEKGSDPSAPWTVVIGIIGAILTFALIVALQVLFHRVQDSEEEKKVYSQVSEQLAQIKSQQLENLNSYRWLDRKAGRVEIPIDRAMQLVVAEQAAASSQHPGSRERAPSPQPAENRAGAANPEPKGASE